jgi:hypothetical protein
VEDATVTDEHAERIIRLLEEIRDGQRLQLERQAIALERQAGLVAKQTERLASLSGPTGQASSVEAGAEQVLVRSAKLVASARILTFIALPFAVLLLAFIVWVLFAHVAR